MRIRVKFLVFVLTLVALLSVVGGSFAQELAMNESVITLDNGVVGTLIIPEVEGAMPAVLMLHGFASSR
ncbi:MAG: hypothetical protein H7175_08935, partial [Burkholderiales bacterium]|nr:hypothetical protein [Anaerolineae bacterium]